MALVTSSGKVTFLRVHDFGTRFGPPTDELDVEVVMKLDSQPDIAMGFQLRNDRNGPARRGMLDLLRDAMRNNWTATIDYKLESGRHNGVMIRVAVTK